MKYRDTFWYGTSYSPLVFPKTDWESDLTLMAAAKMNIIRLGDVHGSWDRIEPQEGIYEFDILADFYQESADFGISIMISTGSASPPLWLAKKYPDMLILSNKNMRYPLGSSYGWACIHHPGYLEVLKRYLSELINFTSTQNNHFGWQISNEIGFPFLPSRGSNELDVFCYCDHCQNAFRRWVKKKYSSLDVVNKEWSWGTTNLVYNNWEDVFPPQGLPGGWASVTKWIDWRLFWQDAFADFTGWQHKLIKISDPNHPTSVNTFNFKGFDRFGALTGLDQWKISRQVDHVGYDLYPGSGNKLVSRPEHNSIFLDHGRSVAKFAGTDFWLHEVESGPIGGWVMGPEYNTDEVDILRNGFEAIGHDVKLMMYMPWKEWDYQPLHWGALVDLEGKETSRLAAAGSLGKFIQENKELILQSHPAASEIAILESKTNAIFFDGIGQEEEVFHAQRGAYTAFWDLGYNVDFIMPTLLEQSIDKYMVILLPLMGLLDLDSIKLLNEFVHHGGVLFGFARCASLTEKGWYSHELPPAPLKEVFGIIKAEPDLLKNRKIILDGEYFDGHINRDKLVLDEGTQVLATFNDGYPAVIVHPFHQGKGVYISSQLDAAYVLSQNKLLPKVIGKLNLPNPRVILNYPEKHRRDIDAHLLTGASGELIVFTNYRNQPAKVKVSINLNDQVISKLEEIFPEKREIPFVNNNKRCEFDLDFKGEEVKTIQIFK